MFSPSEHRVWRSVQVDTPLPDVDILNSVFGITAYITRETPKSCVLELKTQERGFYLIYDGGVTVFNVP